jgi:hypothetical protein
MMRKGFWLAHGANHSRAKIVYASVYRVPRVIGEFDIALFGAILLHLRDPFGALAAIAPLIRDRIMITEPEWFAAAPLFAFLSESVRQGPASVRWMSWWARPFVNRLLSHVTTAVQTGLPLVYFLPNSRTRENFHSWWHFSPQTLKEFLQVIGFTRTSCIGHTQTYMGRSIRMWTIVGER